MWTAKYSWGDISYDSDEAIWVGLLDFDEVEMSRLQKSERLVKVTPTGPEVPANDPLAAPVLLRELLGEPDAWEGEFARLPPLPRDAIA